MWLDVQLVDVGGVGGGGGALAPSLCSRRPDDGGKLTHPCTQNTILYNRWSAPSRTSPRSSGPMAPGTYALLICICVYMCVGCLGVCVCVWLMRGFYFVGVCFVI